MQKRSGKAPPERKGPGPPAEDAGSASSNWRGKPPATARNPARRSFSTSSRGPRERNTRYLAWDEIVELGEIRRNGNLNDIRKTARASASKIIYGTEDGFVREKIASGVILVRTPDQSFRAKDSSGGRREYQALLVKGRVSYAFNEFTHGKYDRQRLDTVRDLIKNMSMEERRLIFTLDFDKMWNYTWSGAPAFNWRGLPAWPSSHNESSIEQKDFLFSYRRERFNSAWLTDDVSGPLLRRLLNEAQGTGRERWEYPKGKRINKFEPDVICALREFEEETQIKLENICLRPGFCRIEIYLHMNVLYMTTFYLAVLARDIPDPAGFIQLANPEQISEVSDVKWMGLADMRITRGPAGRDLTQMGKAAFKFVRDYNKNRTPRSLPRSLVASFAEKTPRDAGAQKKKRGKDPKSRPVDPEPSDKSRGKKKGPRSPESPKTRPVHQPIRHAVSLPPRAKPPPSDDGWEIVGKNGKAQKSSGGGAKSGHM